MSAVDEIPSDRELLARIYYEEFAKDRAGFGSCDFGATLADVLIAAGFSRQFSVIRVSHPKTDAHELHTANLQTERAYLRESAFDRKLSDHEQATIDRLDAVIAERLGL